MKKFYTLFFSFLFILSASHAQKVIEDCTIVFDVDVIDRSASEEVISTVANAVKTSYINKNRSRNDYVAPGYKEVTFYDDNCDTITILKEMGSNKSISYIQTKRFGEKINLYKGIRFVMGSETKKILGYECRMAQAQFPNGKYYRVYYTPMIQPSHRAYEQEFSDLPGLVLEYEAYLENMATTVKYTAVWIDFTPVQTSFFKVPTEDYTANR